MGRAFLNGRTKTKEIPPPIDKIPSLEDVNDGQGFHLLSTVKFSGETGGDSDGVTAKKQKSTKNKTTQSSPSYQVSALLLKVEKDP